ncbi:ATPase [Desulfolithobacter dissulfuricans]|uniref:histidine kinase n=1 Tax=Desulfolithobacter dissulfuricans TaxID=2795293 RepID=A0A915U5F1_9BACT|nr:chemotaxis protein CheW [Desulfolithobacter dissulfuricans]BCO09007.1 ATPase [Desulfolithobacter dissulfuricans]
MPIEDDEILQGFIEESLEHLADIENDLLAIEDAGADIDDDLVNKVFRAAHSIKGGAGFMGLTVIQELAHATENVLGLIRSRKLVPTPEIINVLLQASDELQQLIENIHDSNEVDISEHLNALNAIYEGGEAAAPPVAASESEPESASEEKPEETAAEEEVETEAVTPESEPEPEPVQAAATVETPPPKSLEPAPTQSTPDPPKKAKKKLAATSHKPDTTIRVNVSLLDQLMNLAGELVLSRNQLLQTITSGDVRNAEAVGQRIDLVTSELQEAIMLTRMQPIGNVFNKFPRVVRDLAKKLGRQIELTIVGKEVELDRTIIEAINDPLTHLIRNSVDHGIEPPEERIKKGKDARGLIVLKAYHEAGQVVIEISDDGKGLDGDMIAQAAINKGLITAEQAKTMSEKEKINLILLPGFSTAKEVTDVSGRGVGMDVVKTNLDKLGGSIEIESEVGKGTTISIKLPLTLAIIPCQIVMTGGERYAIPQVNLEELLRIPAAQVKDRVERVGDAEVVRLRGNLLPLIRLSDVLEIERTYYDPKDGETKLDRRVNIADRRSRKSPLFRDSSESREETVPPDDTDRHERKSIERRQGPASALNIVVVSTGTMKYGVIVDRLHDSEEIVIKPLGRHLQQCRGYAGATIMGDGRIALILDVSNLAQMAGLTSMEGSDRAQELAEAAKEAIIARRDKQALLIFRSSEEEQFGVPLNMVERVEKIKITDIEDVGGRRVMQYRGGSLPLLCIDDVAMVQPIKEQDDLLVIVFHLANKDIGLLAIGPVDAIEVAADIDDVTLKQTGIMGSAIIDGQTTMLVDIFELVQAVHPEWFADLALSEVVEEEEAATILVVEDSNFFRNQVKGYMEEAGYHVIEAEDGVQAFHALEERADEISLVVTDIEMPNMDGFELTEKIRSDPRFANLPVIALTTLAADEDIAKGKAVGFNEYHIKLDKERLMESVHKYARQAVAA